jgi:hypothetical protein
MTAATIRDLLDRLQHLRVMPDVHGSPESLDIRNVIDGRSCTIGYARNQELADWLNETFEMARNLRNQDWTRDRLCAVPDCLQTCMPFSIRCETHYK